MDGDGNDGVTAGDGSDSAVVGQWERHRDARKRPDSVYAGNGRTW